MLHVTGSSFNSFFLLHVVVYFSYRTIDWWRSCQRTYQPIFIISDYIMARS